MRAPRLAQARRVDEALDRFVAWLDAFGELSQDQYDFWAGRLGRAAKRTYYRRPRLGTVAVAPFALLDAFVPATRALVRRPSRFPIADAHYAMGFFALASSRTDSDDVSRGEAFLERLLEARCPGYADHAWGYPFDWETNSGVYRSGWPLITTIPYCYEAFEAGLLATGNEEYARVMESIARLVADEFDSIDLGSGGAAARYSPFDRRVVVNASAYRGFLLTAAAERFGNDEWRRAADDNIEFVLTSQASDGSWLYGMEAQDAFIDNFHTCFVIKGLAKTYGRTGDERLLGAVRRGFDFYLERLQTTDGRPRPFARRHRLSLHREELYDYAEGINLALLLRDLHASASRVLGRLVEVLLDDWQLPDGHFVTRTMVVGRNTVPYHRWAQSQTFRALALYAAARP